MKNKYQPRHARRKAQGSEYAPTVWLYSFFAALVTMTLLVRYNGATGIFTLSWLASFVRMFAYIGVMTVAYAFLTAASYVAFTTRDERRRVQK